MHSIKSGEWLKNVRSYRRIPKQEILSKAGISLSMLEAIESGRTNPPREILARLISALGLPGVIGKTDSQTLSKAAQEIGKERGNDTVCYIGQIFVDDYTYYIGFKSELTPEDLRQTDISWISSTLAVAHQVFAKQAQGEIAYSKYGLLFDESSKDK